MIDIKDFYLLGSKLSSTTFQAHPISLGSSKDDNGLFETQRILLGKYDNIKFPVIFRQEDGSRLRDTLDTGSVNLLLVSDQLLCALEEASLTGWKTFDIKVFDKKRKEIKGYSGLSVTGRCGSINYDDCEVIEKRLVPQGPISKYYKGLYVGLDSWDGTDFFIPENYFGIIVSKKAAKVLKKGKFSNIRLKNLSEIETPEFALHA